MTSAGMPESPASAARRMAVDREQSLGQAGRHAISSKLLACLPHTKAGKKGSH